MLIKKEDRMKKKCIKCKKKFEAETGDKNKYCPECVERLCKDLDNKRKQELEDYNLNTKIKKWGYIWRWY